MTKIIKLIQSKINGLIFSLVFAGIILLILAVLIVWSSLVLQFAVGVFIVVVAYMLLFGAYKVWKFKDEVEKVLKIK